MRRLVLLVPLAIVAVFALASAADALRPVGVTHQTAKPALRADPHGERGPADRAATAHRETPRTGDHRRFRDSHPNPRGSSGRCDGHTLEPTRKTTPVAIAPSDRRHLARHTADAGPARHLPGRPPHRRRRASAQVAAVVLTGLRARHRRPAVVRRSRRCCPLVGAHRSAGETRGAQGLAPPGVRSTRCAPAPPLRRRVQPPGASADPRSARHVRHGSPRRLRRPLAAPGGNGSAMSRAHLTALRRHPRRGDSDRRNDCGGDRAAPASASGRRADFLMRIVQLLAANRYAEAWPSLNPLQQSIAPLQTYVACESLSPVPGHLVSLRTMRVRRETVRVLPERPPSPAPPSASRCASPARPYPQAYGSSSPRTRSQSARIGPGSCLPHGSSCTSNGAAPTRQPPMGQTNALDRSLFMFVWPLTTHRQPVSIEIRTGDRTPSLG